MNPITVTIIQDNETVHPVPLDESLAGSQLMRQSERYREAVLAPQVEAARSAVQQGTDLLCFREDCNGAGAYLHRLDRPDLLASLAEPIPGGLTSACLAELARVGKCYTAGCFLEVLGGLFYNTAVLLSPRGELVGKYQKTHLPPVERLQLTAGNNFPVFETDIGRVGMLICYDMMTPEAARCLALNNADLLYWPSLGYGWWDEAGDFTIRSRAHDNQVYILGALRTDSCIVDPYGNFIAQAGKARQAALRASIYPGEDPVQDIDHHNAFLTQTPSLRERHLFERRPELYDTLTEPHPPLTQRYPHTHMHDLERDPLAACERYHNNLDRLHWVTRPSPNRNR